MPDQPTSTSLPPENASPPTPEQLKADLSQAGGALKAAAAEVREEALSEADRLKQAATEQLASAKDKAMSYADARKGEAADQLAGLSQAVSRTAVELQSEQPGAPVARLLRDLAGGLDRVSDSVRNNDADQLIGMAGQFYRRQPLAFLGSAAVAGFIASRFLVASAHRRELGATDVAQAASPSAPALDTEAKPAGQTYPQGALS